MKKLELEPYCQEGCSNFKVCVTNRQIFEGHIYIRCEHDSQCAYLVRYLKKRIGKENLNDKD